MSIERYLPQLIFCVLSHFDKMTNLAYSSEQVVILASFQEWTKLTLSDFSVSEIKTNRLLEMVKSFRNFT